MPGSFLFILVAQQLVREDRGTLWTMIEPLNRGVKRVVVCRISVQTAANNRYKAHGVFVLEIYSETPLLHNVDNRN